MRANAIEKKLEGVFDKRQAVVLAEVIAEAYNDLVKVSDFTELKNVVAELAEAQKNTEKHLDRLTAKMEELAEAQKNTEKRLDSLTVRVEELAEAQKRTEARLEELAEAQKRTEARVEELAEAQKRTEARVEELAEAQKRTEEALRLLALSHDKLAGEHEETRRQLGGLAATVGYRLEDEAYRALPRLLQRDYGLAVEGRLKRRFVTDNRGRKIEVNIIGEALRDGERVTVVGESKSQLSKNDVDRFIKNKLKRLEGIYPALFPVLVTYMISEPDAEDYAREKGVALYYSYDF
jgi:chromosome segregation ATPase